MRNRSTTPPNDVFALQRKRAIFPSLKWGRGGLNFSSILSKIVLSKTDIYDDDFEFKLCWQTKTRIDSICLFNDGIKIRENRDPPRPPTVNRLNVGDRWTEANNDRIQPAGAQTAIEVKYAVNIWSEFELWPLNIEWPLTRGLPNGGL